MTLTLALLAVVAGPAGISLGWWLNERSEQRRFDRNAEQLRRDAERTRLVAVTRQARKVSGELRAMAGGMYLLKSRQLPMTAQMTATMDEFNALWREFEAMAIESEVLGATWLADVVDPVLDAGRQMMETLQRMQQRMTSEDIVLVQEQLKTVDETVAALTASVRDRLASELVKPRGSA